MSNPFSPWNASFALSVQAARIGWEVQAVVFLRWLRIAKAAQKPKLREC
jgi:hypothetical protein